MSRYILQRLIHTVPLLLGISFISFLIMNLAPGDFLTTMSLNPQVSKELIIRMRRDFGLDQPWPIQFLKWLFRLLQGDFGYSFSSHIPVVILIKERLWNTFVLAFVSSVITWILAIILGIISAVKYQSITDKICSFLSFVGLSLPEVFLSLLLVFFAAKTGLFPIGGMYSETYDSLTIFGKVIDLSHHLVLPAFVLVITGMAGLMRQMRGNLRDVLSAEYIKTARAKGLSEQRVIFKHAVRNAINPLITLFGYTLASLLSGSFLVEIVFSWPGMARLTVDALFAHDLYLVMGTLLISSILLIIGNLAADIMLAMSDPRISF